MLSMYIRTVECIWLWGIPLCRCLCPCGVDDDLLADGQANMNENQDIAQIQICNTHRK